jgi:hypothetical protein
MCNIRQEGSSHVDIQKHSVAQEALTWLDNISIISNVPARAVTLFKIYLNNK